MKNVAELLRKVKRVDISTCNCHLGAHLEVNEYPDGDYVRWSDLEALLAEEEKEEKLTILVYSPDTKAHSDKCTCMICPHCGATEVDDCSKPPNEWKFQIKAFRVDNKSHCLICDSWF